MLYLSHIAPVSASKKQSVFLNVMYCILYYLKVKENWELSNDEKISTALSLKEKGTKYFKVSVTGVYISIEVSVIEQF